MSSKKARPPRKALFGKPPSDEPVDPLEAEGMRVAVEALTGLNGLLAREDLDDLWEIISVAYDHDPVFRSVIQKAAPRTGADGGTASAPPRKSQWSAEEREEIIRRVRAADQARATADKTRN